MRNAPHTDMQGVATAVVAAGVFDRESADVAPSEPSGDAGCSVLATCSPETGDHEESGIRAGVLFAAPFPAFVLVCDVDEGPEFQKPAPPGLVDPVHVERKASFCQGADASNAGMAIGVARDATVLDAEGVLMKRAEWPAFDLGVEIGRNEPLRHWTPCEYRKCIVRFSNTQGVSAVSLAGEIRPTE